MTSGLVLTALSLGFRHGVDWDHIAAIADLTSSAESRRRGFVLSFLYASGHAVVVFVLGVAAIVFGSSLPTGADDWMGRVVGLTLIAMGAWIVVDLVRNGRNFRLRSRWILVLHGTFGGLRRVRDASRRRRVVVEHDHAHEHEPTPAHSHEMAHDHAHEPVGVEVEHGQPLPAGRWSRLRSAARPATHQHRHRHELSLAGDPSLVAGNGTAAGIGVLHGIGFESPTQIALFVASTTLVDTTAQVTVLLAWVVGLLLANSALAALAGFGLLQAERSFMIYAAIAVTVAVLSIAMGALYLAGGEVPYGLLT